MKIPSISKVRNLNGKRVLVRVDFNVPLGSNARVDEDEDWRLLRVLPTIELLRSRGARVILMSHLGRPVKKTKADSLQPVARYMHTRCKLPLTFVSDCVGPRVATHIAAMHNRDVVLLENLRFHKGEEENNKRFARELAQLGDIFVNDAFAVSHREAASVVGVAGLLPSYAGLLFEEELQHVHRIMHKPKKPFVVVVGGAKASTKLPLLESFVSKAQTVLIGGAIANTALHCNGYDVGKGQFEPCTPRLKKVFRSRNVVMPLDVVVGTKDGAHARVVILNKANKKLVKRGEYVQDIGPATIGEYDRHIMRAKTILWNGAMGVFEIPAFAYGTLSLARALASRAKGPAFGVVGGGETVQALRRTGMEEFVDHVSTGGGALLALLSGEQLPGVEALKQKST